MFQIDHLGIAVKSLAAAKDIYEKLGLAASGEEVVEGEHVRVAMLPVGESRLELMEATSEASAVANKSKIRNNMISAIRSLTCVDHAPWPSSFTPTCFGAVSTLRRWP